MHPQPPSGGKLCEYGVLTSVRSRAWERSLSSLANPSLIRTNCSFPSAASPLQPSHRRTSREPAGARIGGGDGEHKCRLSPAVAARESLAAVHAAAPHEKIKH
jgi:hypothetical protein